MSLPWEIAYCVNLDRRVDRREAASAEFERTGLDVEWFSATDWQDLPREWGGYMTKKVPMHHNVMGHIACGLSHQRAMQDAIEKDRQSVCIFEDDVQLTKHFWNVLGQGIDQLPRDWQFLYLGYRAYKSNSAITRYSPNLVEVHKCYDAHAYVVRQPLLARLVLQWDPIRLTTDWQFQKIRDVRFGLSPKVAIQNKLLASEMDPTVGGLI